MTKADAARLVAIVVTAYPNYDKFKDAKAIEATVNLWAMMFEQDESGIVALAVKKHIATNKWPPSVAEVREIMLEIQHPELIEPDKAYCEATQQTGERRADGNQENRQRLYEPCACVGIEGDPRTLRGRHCRNQRGQTTTSEGAELNPSGGGSS